jgi:hypothetical protein
MAALNPAAPGIDISSCARPLTFRKRRRSYTSAGNSRDNNAISITNEAAAADWKGLADRQLAIANAAVDPDDADEEYEIHVSVCGAFHFSFFFLSFESNVDLCITTVLFSLKFLSLPSNILATGGHEPCLDSYGRYTDGHSASHLRDHHSRPERRPSELRDRLPLSNAK